MVDDMAERHLVRDARLEEQHSRQLEQLWSTWLEKIDTK
jgi:hypothetical protein